MSELNKALDTIQNMPHPDRSVKSADERIADLEHQLAEANKLIQELEDARNLHEILFGKRQAGKGQDNE